MATKYRGENETLTISIELEIPGWEMPEGIDPESAGKIKISGLPVALRQLDADLAIHKNFIKKLQKELDSTRTTPIKRINTIAPRPPELGLNEIALAGVEEYCYREEREEKGIYHRGKKAKAPDIYIEMADIAKWLHAVFRYYRYEKKNRPTEVKKIYETKKGSAEPNLMTYYCCSILYRDRLASLEVAFPKQESFQKKYLASAGSWRPLNNSSFEEVAKKINDPTEKLYIIHKIYRKLQN